MDAELIGISDPSPNWEDVTPLIERLVKIAEGTEASSWLRAAKTVKTELCKAVPVSAAAEFGICSMKIAREVIPHAS